MEKIEYMFKDVGTDTGDLKALHQIEGLFGEHFMSLSSDDYERIEEAIKGMRKEKDKSLASFLKHYNGLEEQKKLLSSYL